MKNRQLASAIALLLSGLLASPAFSPLSAAPGAAVLGKIVSAAPTAVNGVGIPADATLFTGDRIATGPGGWARIFLPPGHQIHLGSQTEARVQRIGTRLEVELFEGRLALRTRGSNDVHVYSPGLEIVPRTAADAVWEVARLGEGLTLVVAHQGTIEALSLNRSVEVRPGQSVQIRTRLEQEGDPDGQKPASAGPDDCGCRYLGAIVFVTLFGAAAAIMIPLAAGPGPEDGIVVSPAGFARLR